MGSQEGNLRAQLVKDGVSSDREEAKLWIRENCTAQWLEKAELDRLGIEIKWAEHFMLSVLRPRFGN